MLKIIRSKSRFSEVSFTALQNKTLTDCFIIKFSQEFVVSNGEILKPSKLSKKGKKYFKNNI